LLLGLCCSLCASNGTNIRNFINTKQIFFGADGVQHCFRPTVVRASGGKKKYYIKPGFFGLISPLSREHRSAALTTKGFQPFSFTASILVFLCIIGILKGVHNYYWPKSLELSILAS